MSRRGLILDSRGLAAYVRRNGHLQREAAFAGDATGHAAFADYLARHRQSRFVMLVDTSEESCRLEDLPRASGRDRRALLDRRLGQHFNGMGLATAMSLGRPKGMRSESVMFTALTNPQDVQPWLAALRNAQSRFTGLFSPPQLLPALHGLLPRGSDHRLVLVMSNDGLRQGYFAAGQLRFCRSTALAAPALQAFPAACASEAEKVHQYLIGKRMLERSTRLDIVVLAHPHDRARLAEACRDSAALRFTCADLVELSTRTGLASVPPDSRADVLFLQLLLRKPPAAQLSPATETRFDRLAQWRLRLDRAAAIGLAAGLLVAAKAGLDIFEFDRQRAALAADIAAGERRYQAALGTLPRIPISIAQLRSLIAADEMLEKRSPKLEATLLHISRALEAVPDIDLDRIDWFVSANPDATASAAGEAGSRHYVVCELQAHTSAAVDQRKALAMMDGFVGDLKRAPAMTVNVVRSPAAEESGQVISNSMQPNMLSSFSLRLVQPL